jgi:hypothetical protein
MVGASRGLQAVFYVLELFREGDAGEKHRLRSLGYEASSEDQALLYAQAFLRNVTFDDERPTLCLIKKVGGKVLRIVSAQSSVSQTAKQEAP